MRLALVGIVPAIILQACSEPADPGRSSAAPQPASSAPSPNDEPAMPPEARRNSVPQSMQILADGAPAPPMLDLVSTDGSWSRGDNPTIVVFYRGFW